MTTHLPRPANLRFARFGLLVMAIFLLLPGAGLITGSAYAQGSSSSTPTSGSAPALGNTVQGQSSGTPESALRSAMNYLGNVICPIISVAFFVLAIINYRAGKGVAAALITAVALLAVSGIVRYAESLVTG